MAPFEVIVGEEILAKKVIATTDPQMTFLDLVGEEACNAVSPTLVSQAKIWEWESTSLFNVHYALSERPRYEAGAFGVGLLLASRIDSLENFAGVMNFVVFPMFLTLTGKVTAEPGPSSAA